MYMMKKPKKNRRSRLTEEEIKYLGNVLSEKYRSGREILDLRNQYGYRGNLTTLMLVLESRGFVCAEYSGPGKSVNTQVVFYKIVTKKDYEEYEEEHRKNVTRRLLETVSC